MGVVTSVNEGGAHYSYRESNHAPIGRRAVSATRRATGRLARPGAYSPGVSAAGSRVFGKSGYLRVWRSFAECNLLTSENRPRRPQRAQALRRIVSSRIRRPSTIPHRHGLEGQTRFHESSVVEPEVTAVDSHWRDTDILAKLAQANGPGFRDLSLTEKPTATGGARRKWVDPMNGTPMSRSDVFPGRFGNAAQAATQGDDILDYFI